MQHTYLLLAQLAATYSRRRMSETAAIVDAEDEILAGRFGAVEQFRAPPRLPWLADYIRRLEQYRARAEVGNQYGEADRTTQLVCTIMLSLIARCLNEGEQLAPADVESLMGAVRKAVEASMQRIAGAAELEGAKVHALARVDQSYRHQEFLRQQERERAAAELAAAKARVEALTKQEHVIC